MTITVETGLEPQTCASCGMLFAAPAHWVQRHCREKGEPLFCPAGHRLTFGKGELDKVRDELARQKHLREQADAAADSANAAAAVAERKAKRLKHRVSGGTCPCCKRSFVALARHMATKHPSFVKEAKP